MNQVVFCEGNPPPLFLTPKNVLFWEFLRLCAYPLPLSRDFILDQLAYQNKYISNAFGYMSYLECSYDSHISDDFIVWEEF